MYLALSEALGFLASPRRAGTRDVFTRADAVGL